MAYVGKTRVFEMAPIVRHPPVSHQTGAAMPGYLTLIMVYWKDVSKFLVTVKPG